MNYNISVRKYFKYNKKMKGNDKNERKNTKRNC